MTAHAGAPAGRAGRGGRKAPRLRPVRLFERQWPWLLAAGLLAFAMAGWLALVFTGALEGIDAYWFSGNARGYTATGLTFAGVAVGLAFVALMYSVRKRGAGKTTMMTWLWVHVYAGLLALVAAALHAGFGLTSAAFTSGKVLFFLFALLVFTGIAWRLAYAFVPGLAAPQILNYSKVGSVRRAEEQVTEIEKLAAGKSEPFHRAKDWLLAGARGAAEVMQAAASLPAEERAAFEDVARLAASRSRALGRVEMQAKYTRFLQGWRVLHVPVALLFVVALVAHVLGALDLPARALPVGTATTGPLAAYAPSEDCRACHTAIYDSWAESMHAHALTSPLTIAQTNLDAHISLAGAQAPDPKYICVNCHAPTGSAMAGNDTLPLAGGEITNHGISCTSCHQHGGTPTSGSGGFTAKFQADLDPGRTFYGPLKSPVGNAYHKSDEAPLFKDPSTLCAACHDVNLDRNDDGKIVKGQDLVLQTTYDEFKEYKAAGGGGDCVTCHMPVMAKVQRAANGADVPLDQDFDAPPREVHDHGFVGVDYPLDTVKARDPQRPLRDRLLKSAARLTISGAPAIEGGSVTLRVRIENLSGHNLPTGFAFARQMWLEVSVLDAAGAVLASSGRLAKASDDLCDNETVGDPKNPLSKDTVGCAEPDPQLVNIQLKLVDKIVANGKNDRGEPAVLAAPDSKETFLQFITGGPATRTRPSDKTPLGTIPILAHKDFGYAFPGVARTAASVSVRLLFRNLPPYFIRAMAKIQVQGDAVRLGPLVERLQITEMATATAPVAR